VRAETVGSQYGPDEVTIDAERVAAIAALLELRSPGPGRAAAPATADHCLPIGLLPPGARDAEIRAAMTGAPGQTSGGRMLASIEVRQYEPLPLGERLEVRSQIVDVTLRYGDAGTTWFGTYESTYTTSAGQMAWSVRTTMAERERPRE
jgi:hypothetical protein